jgi:hypothetical protein
LSLQCRCSSRDVLLTALPGAAWRVAAEDTAATLESRCTATSSTNRNGRSATGVPAAGAVLVRPDGHLA